MMGNTSPHQLQSHVIECFVQVGERSAVLQGKEDDTVAGVLLIVFCNEICYYHNKDKIMIKLR